MKDYMYIDWYEEIILFKDTLSELDDLFDGCEENTENNIAGYFIDPNDPDDPLKIKYQCFQGDFTDFTVEEAISEEDPYVLGA